MEEQVAESCPVAEGQVAEGTVEKTQWFGETCRVEEEAGRKAERKVEEKKQVGQPGQLG
jgi:hypothetical protein